MNRRRWLVGAGVAAGVVGLAMALSPGLAAGVGADRAFVLLVGVLAAAGALADVQALRSADVDQADPGEPETGPDLPRAGADVDATLAAAATGLDRYDRVHRDDLHERIESAALDLLARQEDCTPGEAAELLASGSWTDDPYAAAFLGGVDAATLPLSVRIRDAISPEARFARRARRAIAALAARSEP